MATFRAIGGQIGGGQTHDIVGTPTPIGTIKVNGTTYTKYRQIVNFGTLPTATAGTKAVAHGISGLDFRKVLSIYGSAIGSAESYVLPNSIATGFIAFYVNNTNIVASTNLDWSNYSAVMTIEYYQ